MPMRLHRTLARLLIATSLLAAGLVASASTAAADFHIMKVDEVFAGSAAQPNADFVELRMAASGQNIVGGHELYLYEASGTRHACTIPSNVPNNDLNDRILFATSLFTSATPDFVIPPLLAGTGGAVCFETSVDCVSWGSFGGSTTNPAGTPFPGGIPPDQSIDRTPDNMDTQNSAADFDAASPTPQNNAGNLGTMTCQVAPGPGPGGGGPGGASLRALKAKVRGNRAIITGRIEPPAPGERVSLTFFANGSPLRKIAKAKATLNSASKFKKGFRVPGDSTRCKVQVKFRGANMGKKTFRC
jgi:hypothetical protein